VQADLRSDASADIDSAINHYRSAAGPETALDFVNELQTAIDHGCHEPLSGSLRFAYELEIPGLLIWSLRKFPYLVFYMTDGHSIDIWRVLQARRDIPAYLASDPPE
jgi:toxin ParE1/3/4